MSGILGNLFRSLLLFSIILLIFSDCEKDNECRFPSTNVNVTYHYSDLANIGNLQYKIDTTVRGSYGGVIIFRKTRESFVAYDLACPYDLPKTCVLTVKNPYLLVCPCCSSEFNLYSGMVEEGPARCALKQYNTHYDPQNKTLHVTE